MHINGDFEDFSYLWCLVWVGNINNPWEKTYPMDKEPLSILSLWS